MRYQRLSKAEIVFAVRSFYELHKFIPRIKDIPKLPFSKKYINEIFGTWSKMLMYADLPLNRNPPRMLKCANCATKFIKQVKEIKKSLRHFCSRACSAQLNTTGRKHSEATKAKISNTLKAHRIFVG